MERTTQKVITRFFIFTAIVMTVFAGKCFAQVSDRDSIEALMQRDDYIRPSLLVVSPGEEIYASGGHVALRLHCPLQKIDYIYEYIATDDPAANYAVTYLSGRLSGRYLRRNTADFLAMYAAEGRRVTEIPLRLSPDEEVRLWATLDERVDTDSAGAPFVPFSRNCCSMLLEPLAACTEPAAFSVAASAVSGSRREHLRDFFASSPWTGLMWNILLGYGFDHPDNPISTVYPKILGDYLTNVKMAGAPQPLADHSEYSSMQQWQAPDTFFTPTVTFAIFLLLIVLLTAANLRQKLLLAGNIADCLMVTAAELAGIVLWYQMLFSVAPMSGFNLAALVFTPAALLLILRRTRRAALIYTLGVSLLLLILAPFMGQISGYDFWMFILAAAIRSAYRLRLFRFRNNQISH